MRIIRIAVIGGRRKCVVVRKNSKFMNKNALQCVCRLNRDSPSREKSKSSMRRNECQSSATKSSIRLLEEMLEEPCNNKIYRKRGTLRNVQVTETYLPFGLWIANLSDDDFVTFIGIFAIAIWCIPLSIVLMSQV